MISEVFNMDCVAYMQTLPDNFFDLAIVDPPYGIGECGGDKNRRRKGDNHKKIVTHTKKEWDNEKPNSEYFKELFRVSENQIVWGGNYFSEYLPSRMGWVFWNKLIGGDFSDGELAWTSWQRALRMYTYSYHGDTKGGHSRIHPTQKPIALYKWLIEKYAKAGDKLFDSHMGSQSSRIAAYHMGFDYWGCELDEEYFNNGNKRFIRETMQQSLFTPTIAKKETVQQNLFQ